ncbi:MAG: LysM peptidoglycan-binding domain-containing protein [Thiothrix sp.]|nr:LysM peptidoglycan-binding domain-containing protein [Thiothrix sp.]
MKFHKPMGLAVCSSLFLFNLASAEPDVDDELALDLKQLEQVLAQGTRYTVVSGDSLSKIAQGFYADPSLWPAILNSNNERLKGDPMGLRPGMTLRIPALEEAMADKDLSGILPGEQGAGLEGPGPFPADLSGINPYLPPPAGNMQPVPRTTRTAVRVHPDWLYSEGVARAIRREYMTFENAGRIAFLDPKLKEGDWVKKGQVLAYQDQSRPAATVATASAQLVSANTQLTSAHSQLTGAQSQLADADAQLVRANTQLAVAEANRMEADANLQLAQRTFQRYATLLKQKSASQQEYDSAEAQLTAAKAGVRRSAEQINSARADINVARTGITTAKANVDTAKAGVAAAKAGVGTAQANVGSANVTKKESHLVSPIDGVVARINVEQGYYYSPQYIQSQSEQQLFNTVPIILIDPRQFEVTIRLPYDQYDNVKVGAEAYIDIVDINATLEERLPSETAGPQKALSSYPIRGRIYSVSPVLDTDLRNFIITVRTTQGQNRLRDGENVSLWIRRARQQAANP